MPSWKDNLTGPEIDALHKYKTQGKESLSGDEIDIVHKYRTYLKPQDTTKSKALLGLEAIEPSAPVQKDKEPSIIEKGLSAGAAVGGVLASPLQGLGNIAGAIGELAGKGNAEEIASKINQYMPGTQQSPLAQQYAEKIGQVIEPLNAIMPNLQMMHGISRPMLLRPPKVAEPVITMADRVAKAREELAPKQEEQVQPTVQTELELGQPNQYGVRPSEFTVDENGHPIRTSASVEAQLTERGGQDLFSPENVQREMVSRNLADWEQPTEGFPPSREYLKQQEIEQAYLQKQQQEGALQEAPVVEPTQASPLMEKIKGTGVTNRSPLGGVGKKQGGAIDVDTFLSMFPSFRGTKIADSTGKPKLMYHGTDREVKGAFRLPADDSRQLGIHFGDKDAANTITKEYRESFGTEYKQASNVHEVYLDVKNPLRMEDRGIWRPSFVVEALEKEALSPQQQSILRQWLNENPQAKELYSNVPDRKVRALLDKLGYDGVIYKNAHEGTGESVIVLDPKRIQSAISPKVGVGGAVPMGQTSMGKSQRGSVGFPQKKAPTLEQYKKNIEQELEREVSNEVANKLYLEDYPHLSQTNKTKTVISKVPGLEEFNKYESRPVLDDPTGIKSVERMERVGDQDITVKMGSTGKSVLSAGRLQGWRSKSPVAYEGIGFITSVKDTYRIKTAEYLSSFNKASQVFDLELFGASQWRKGAQVFDVRRGNERNPKLNPREILNEQQMELFDTMDKTLSTIGKEVKTRLEEVGAKVDFEQLPFYFTSLFTGDYAIPVFNRQTGQFMFNLREVTKTNAFKAKEWLESHPDYKPGEVNISDVSPSVNRQLSEARMMSNFEQMLDLLGRNDPATMEALNVLSGRQTGAGMHTSAMPNRFKEKSGRFGSLGDKPWLSERQNYLDNKKVFEMYVSGANEWLANTQISEFLKNMNSSEKITATNAKSLVNDYGNYVLGLKDSGSAWYKDAMTVVEHSLGRSRGDVAKAARIYSQAVTAQLVGWWSPRAMIQNVFQPAQAAIPMIQKLKYVEGYQGDILASIAKGTHEGILDILDHWKDSDYISATRGFKQDNHVIDAHLVDQIRTVGGSHRAGAIYNTLANRSVSYAEQFARSVTFSIVHNFLESSGIPKERALDMAKNITHEIMVNYEEYAKPQVFGRTGLPGELAGKLQTYKINDLTQTIGYFEDIAKSNPKTWVPISTKLMMSIMFAGLTGIIGMDIAALMWETAQQANSRTEEPNEYLATHTLKDFIYESSPVAVSKGALTALTGYDLSGAFAQNLVGEDPTKSIIPILGKTGEQLAAPINLMSGSDVGVAKGITAFTPSSLSHLPEKHLLTEDRGDEKVVYSPNTGEVTYKGPDQGLFSNLRTNERSRQSAERTSLFKARENISEAKKSAEKSTLNFVVDWATAKTQQDADKAVEKISNNLLKYHNAGGDIETLWGSIEEKLVRVGIADDVLNTLKQDVTMSNRIIFQRALELNELRK